MIKRTFINRSLTRVRATVPFNGIDKKNKIVDFAITNNGKYAVIAYNDDECIVWDIEKNLAIVKIDHLSNPGQNPIALTPDSLTLITCEQSEHDRYFW
jgi:WD40 repeat protein